MYSPSVFLVRPYILLTNLYRGVRGRKVKEEISKATYLTYWKTKISKTYQSWKPLVVLLYPEYKRLNILVFLFLLPLRTDITKNTTSSGPSRVTRVRLCGSFTRPFGHNEHHHKLEESPRKGELEISQRHTGRSEGPRKETVRSGTDLRSTRRVSSDDGLQWRSVEGLWCPL